MNSRLIRKFHKTCEDNDYEGFIELLENGLDVNEKFWCDGDELIGLPLMKVAEKFSRSKFVKVLTERGADVNAEIIVSHGWWLD